MKCPNCGASRVFTDEDGYTVCTSCGLVISNVRFSDLPPRDKEGTLLGVGPPVDINRVDKGLRTVISRTRTAKTPEQAQRVRRLIMTDKKLSLSHREKSLDRLIQEVNRICKSPNLVIGKSIVSEAVSLARVVSEKKLTRGRPCEVMAAGLVAIACNRARTIWTLPQIAKAAGVNVRDVRKCLSFLKKRLGISYISPSFTDLIDSTTSVLTSLYNIPQNLRSEIFRKATTACNEMNKRGLLSGRNPRCVSVAATIAAIELITKKKFPIDNRVLEIAEEGRITLHRRVREVAVFMASAGI